MKMLKVTYVDGNIEYFEGVEQLNRFNNVLSFLYKREKNIACIDTRIRMEEIRKFEVWDTDVD